MVLQNVLNLKDSIVYSFQLTFRGQFPEWLTSVLQYAYLMRLLYHTGRSASAICLSQPLVCQSCCNCGWLFQFLNVPSLYNDELSDRTLPATLQTKSFITLISKNGFLIKPHGKLFLSFIVFLSKKPFSSFHSDLRMF